MRDTQLSNQTTATLTTVLAFCVACVGLVALLMSMGHISYDTWGGLVIGPILVGISIPLLLRWMADDEPSMRRLVCWAFLLKFAGSLIRYFVAFGIYGRADAAEYHLEGVRLAQHYRHGDFFVDIGRRVVGTGFIRLLTGIIYTVTGPTRLGGFLIFSWIGFWGLYLMYRAFRIAVPNGAHRKYALLLFLLPSLLFWPSSIGKEAWMMFALGLCALGAAKLLTGRRGGYIVLALGLAATAMVRPHVTLIVIVALLGAYLARQGQGATRRRRVSSLVGVGVMLLATIVVAGRVETFFGLNHLNAQTVDEVLSQTEARSSQGSAAFKPSRAHTVLDVPIAMVSVLFRPFPWEARSGAEQVASAESLILLCVTFLSLPRFFGGLPLARRWPYMTWALIASLLFTIAFSSIGNFGIIARQRVQILPVFIVLLALPRPSVPGGRTESDRGIPLPAARAEV